MTRAICFSLLAFIVASSAACRRENPTAARSATVAAVAAASQRATAVVTTPSAIVEATFAADRPTATVRRAKVAAGNLGVAATGISAGIQLWSRPGGVLAGGATMTGTVSDGLRSGCYALACTSRCARARYAAIWGVHAAGISPPCRRRHLLITVGTFWFAKR